jgi:hypothetical protein
LQAELKARLESIHERIAAACRRAGRDPAEVTLIAVSKTVAPGLIREAIECGVRVLGENRVQEAAAKITEINQQDVQWHLIGHLQSNKTRRAVELFDAIHSIDSLKLAERLDQIAGEFGKRIPIFLEVNLGEEESKSGISPKELFPLIEGTGKLAHLELMGLMAVPPFPDDPEEVRPFFGQLRELRDEARRSGIAGDGFTELSMGMSNDFEVALEEGATFVRIGTAIFGARS